MARFALCCLIAVLFIAEHGATAVLATFVVYCIAFDNGKNKQIGG